MADSISPYSTSQCPPKQIYGGEYSSPWLKKKKKVLLVVWFVFKSQCKFSFFELMAYILGFLLPM